MRILSFFSIIFFNSHTFGQNFQLIKSKSIDEPTEVSLDRAGNIYFATFQGDIIRLDAQLENKLVFSPINPNTVTILEAWQGLRIFSFHRDRQIYRLINRNLSLDEEYKLPPDFVNFAELATPSFDNNIWIIDQVDFSLVKYNITLNQLMSRTPLDQLLDPDNYEILFCKEYQNRLFVSTRNNGILIFDNFGSYIKTFQYKGISFFNFWKDDLYFLKNNELVRINLYNEKMTTHPLPHTDEWEFILIYEHQMYLFSKNQLAIYK